MDINIMELLGEKICIEDAIFLREIIKNNLNSNLKVTLDFSGFERVPSTFLTSLFNDLILVFGREYIFEHIDVKNLSNIKDYSRVVLGTTFY